MHKEHKKILSEIKKYSGEGTQHSSNDSYIGSGHVYYDVSVPIRRQVAKEWLRANKDISDADFLAVIDSLYKGASHEEKTIASFLLGYHKKGRVSVAPSRVDGWLDDLVGWAEVDSLCQNVFTGDELLYGWKRWQSCIRKLAKDSNINKRRASLVLLVGPTHYTTDKRFVVLAFENIDRLKHDKDILITKAISWLLREMITFHVKAVQAYISKNKDQLPSIAIRETLRKKETANE